MATVTQIAAGSSTTATTTVTFAAQAAGAVLLLHVASDAYMADPGPSGWTLLESYQGNLGHYLYWKTSTGETSVAYTLSPAASSAHAVTAIRAGDRAESARPASPAATLSPSGSMAALREAVEARATVLIGYVDNQGTTSERLVDPIRVEGGSLTAHDHRSDDVRTFAVHRITTVRPAAG